MPTNNKKQKFNIVSLLFWVYILIAVLVLIIGSIVILASNSGARYSSLEDLDQLVGRDIFIQDPVEDSEYAEYYIILYTRSTESDIFKESSAASSEVEDVILNYANFYAKNEDKKITDTSTSFVKMFGSNLDLAPNKGVLTTDITLVTSSPSSFSALKIYQKTMPVMLHMRNGSLVKMYIGYNNIAKQLTTVLEEFVKQYGN